LEEDKMEQEKKEVMMEAAVLVVDMMVGNTEACMEEVVKAE
jgi:hypothetical protein